MTAQRIAIFASVLIVVACAAVATVNAFSDPYAVRRAELEQRIEDIPPPPDSVDAPLQANYSKWQRSIETRPALWDSLFPPAAAKPQPLDAAKEVQGITVLRGSSGSGANARVRLATGDNPRGRMYKVGEEVKPGVVVKEVTGNSVVFLVTKGSQSGTHSLPR